MTSENVSLLLLLPSPNHSFSSRITVYVNCNRIYLFIQFYDSLLSSPQLLLLHSSSGSTPLNSLFIIIIQLIYLSIDTLNSWSVARPCKHSPISRQRFTRVHLHVAVLARVNGLVGQQSRCTIELIGRPVVWQIISDIKLTSWLRWLFSIYCAFKFYCSHYCCWNNFIAIKLTPLPESAKEAIWLNGSKSRSLCVQQMR